MNLVLLLFTTLILSISSEAQGLRCFDLFSKHSLTDSKNSVFFYAEAIDHLNAKYNKFLFKNNLSEVLAPTTDGSSFKERLKARYQAYRLAAVLQKIHQHDQFLNATADLKSHTYALEKLASRLEKLTFLTDENVLASMTFSEKIIYRQAQHSLLSQGLSRFLFHEEKVLNPSQMKTILNSIIMPFKDIYLRWTYSLAYMPKLNGAAVPFSVIEKVVIDGYQAHADVLKPYLNTTNGKYFFNTFSSGYNWLLAGTLAVSVFHLSSTMNEVYTNGQKAALELLNPTLENSKKIAHIDYLELRKKKNFENLLIDFKLKFSRDPEPEELIMIKQLIDSY